MIYTESDFCKSEVDDENCTETFHGEPGETQRLVSRLGPMGSDG